MLSRCRWVLLAVLLLCAGQALAAASAEDAAFTSAYRQLADGLYSNAEAAFAGFIQKYPGSPRLPEAILRQAEARFKIGNYSGSVELLSGHAAQSGVWADQYLFWEAQAWLNQGQPDKADADFSRLIRDFPTSGRRLEAVLGAATARMRRSQWAETVALLGDTNGIFQTLVRSNQEGRFVAEGCLLLSEAHLAQTNLAAAEAALQPIAGLKLDPTNSWERQLLHCRVHLAGARFEAAFESVTNLALIAAALPRNPFQAETSALEGHILERLGRPQQAIAAYQKNLAPEVPADRVCQALLKITELYEAEKKIPEAAEELEKFLAQYPKAQGADLALLTLGNLRLRQHERQSGTNLLWLASTNSGPATNELRQALAAFTSFTNQFPKSPHLGGAELGLGWCFWLEGKLAESRAAFERAAERLAPSLEQAIAFFKVADTDMQQANYAAAIVHYRTVLEKFPAFPAVITNLFEPAFYQIVRAALAQSDWPTATNYLGRLRSSFPDSPHTESAVLLVAYQMGQSDPRGARKLLEDFSSRAGAAPRPQLRLAIAHTYEQAEQWSAAAEQYDSWLTSFTNHPEMPRAQFCRAQANAHAGLTNEAFSQFTNLVAQFPNSPFAPLAQWWVADYYDRQGKIEEAEKNYQLCYSPAVPGAQYTNWAASPVYYHAKLMAGRLAFAREGWTDAIGYFTNLTSDPNCPADLQAQAWFGLGDTFMRRPGAANKLADYQDAFSAYDRICKLYPSNRLAVLAWGAKAQSLLQSAQTSADYQSVSNAFLQVLEAPAADAKARSIARVGLGVTLEKLAQEATAERAPLLQEALRQYTTVFYNDNFLRPDEKPDLFWTKEAGLRAARLLAESLKQRSQAIRILERLQEMFPPLRLEERIRALKSQELTAGQKN